MSVLETVSLIPRDRKTDARGWLLKALDGGEPGLSREVGEVYLVMGQAGHLRGGHYHKVTNEWFTLVSGEATLLLVDPATGERRSVELTTAAPVTAHVPAGVGHAFRNPSHATEPMIIAAYADRRYDPEDTFVLAMG